MVAVARDLAHESCLVLRDVTIAFGTKVILGHVNADIPRGELVNVVGPNGSGKSTLLKAIAGLVPLLGGEITLFGEPIARRRRVIAYVPQREDVDWGFPVSVRDVVTMGRYPHAGWLRALTPVDHEAVDRALALLDITEIGARQIGSLSGGQQRRAFIARAVAQEPDMVLLDEPMAGIDAATHDRILELFEDWRLSGKIVMQATHGDIHGGSMIVLRRRREPMEEPHLEYAREREAGGHDAARRR